MGECVEVCLVEYLCLLQGVCRWCLGVRVCVFEYVLAGGFVGA